MSPTYKKSMNKPITVSLMNAKKRKRFVILSENNLGGRRKSKISSLNMTNYWREKTISRIWASWRNKSLITETRRKFTKILRNCTISLILVQKRRTNSLTKSTKEKWRWNTSLRHNCKTKWVRKWTWPIPTLLPREQVILSNYRHARICSLPKNGPEKLSFLKKSKFTILNFIQFYFI